jgi:anti-sigma B factor antagonist
MQTVITTTCDVAVLHLAGRFDAHEVADMDTWFREATTRKPPRIVVDLQRVTFIDSTALGKLVQAMKHCRQHGGDLRLCGVQQPVRIIFELTRLDRAFAIFPDEATALETPWEPVSL